MGEDFSRGSRKHPPVIEPQLILNKLFEVGLSKANPLEEIDALRLAKGGDFDSLKHELDIDESFPESSLRINFDFAH